MEKIIINGIEYTNNVDTRFAGCEFCDVRIKDYDYFKEHCLPSYKAGNRPCGKATYLKRIKSMDNKKYEEIIKAIREKTHKAQGDEHEIYENLAFDSHSSFGYGVRITLYALSQVLGEDVIQTAILLWLKG